MGRATRVETLNLQTFAMDLKAKGLSDAKIAVALAKRSGQPVTRDAVNSFFRKKNAAKVEVVEKSDKLKKKLVEAEINTIQECLKCLADLQLVFDKAIEDGDLRAAILATGEKWKGIDIINKVLGKYQNLPNPITINQNTVFVSMDEKVKEYEAYFTEIEGTVSSDSP